MLKNLALRLAGAAVLALCSVSLTGAQTAGKDLAMNFRSSTVFKGGPDSGVVTGYAVASPTKVRIDMSTTGGRAPTPFATDGPVSMIVSDSGRTITYLDSKKSEYLTFRPSEMFEELQQMGEIKMDVSGAEATVTSLGAGPAILGHPTARYRMDTGMTMTITGMGQQYLIKVSSTTEYHYPTDLKTAFNPLMSLTGAEMLDVFGGSGKDFAAKHKAAEAKLPKAPPFRIVSSTTVGAQGTTTVTSSNTEVTSVQWVSADPRIFEVPTGYKEIELPKLGGAPKP